MIHSIFIGSDAELIGRILRLHRGGRRVLDVTFGNGRFWRSDDMAGVGHQGCQVVGLDLRMGTELAKLDISRSPQVVGRMTGTYEHLPFSDETFDVVVCDPPFMVRGGNGSRMKQRYSSNESYEHLLLSLQRALSEFVRVLGPDGIVLFKIMDLTEGRQRRWSHIDVANLWGRALRLDDVFIKIAPHSMESPKWTKQARSRVSHSYFMVFRLRRQSRNHETSVDRALPPGTVDILHRSGRKIGRKAAIGTENGGGNQHHMPLVLDAGVAAEVERDGRIWRKRRCRELL